MTHDGQFLRVALLSCEMLVPLKGPRQGARCKFSHLDGKVFKTKSKYFKQSLYSQTVSTMIARLVLMTYICPVWGVGTSHGTVRRVFRVSHLLHQCFKPRYAYFQIIIIFSNREYHDGTISC